MSAQSYINRKRIIADASITKIEYPKGVSSINRLSSTINCDPNFQRIVYNEICRPCIYNPKPALAPPVVPINPFARFNNQIAVISSAPLYVVYSSDIVSYTLTTMTVKLGPSTTNFNVPYTIISSESQLAELNPLAYRSIIFNDTPSTFNLNFSVLPTTITLPPGQLLFGVYGIPAIALSFTIV
jgi:hypothetical protein